MYKLSIVAALLMFVNLASGQEGIAILWPEEYDWKILSNHDNEKLNLIELIPGKENANNWSLLVQMMSLKGVKKTSLDEAIKIMYQQVKKTTPCSKLTLLEEDLESENPWVLFKTEVPCVENTKDTESQLWFICQGKSSLYVNFIAVKIANLENEFIKVWSEVFKNSEIVTFTPQR